MSRKLDIQVAKKMGYQVIETDDCNGEDNYWLSKDGQHVLSEKGWDYELPFYSSNIQDAWKVVDFMRSNGYSLTLQTYQGSCQVNYRGIVDTRSAIGKTVTLGICNAFLAK